MFHPTPATSFPCVRVALPLAGKIRFARYRSVGLAAAPTDCPAHHFSLTATFLLGGFEIVAARKARDQSQLTGASLHSCGLAEGELFSADGIPRCVVR